MRPLEIWGGHECTVNRVGDVWRDQTVICGHQERLDDLDLFAGLGLRTLRYPILWERTERSPGVFDWSWADERLGRLRQLGVRPVVGLVHHGSGPAWTNLLDPGFADGLERFALEVARRYPWVKDWTPVNEPLTTARFSALYGHWYPHLRDETAFWSALLNQIEATTRAMAAIRSVIPDARLIQTEDFGGVLGTDECQAQAAFENERRFMTWDLQTARVTRGHLLWRRLADQGLAGRLEALARRPCPPDLIGVNHYVTSDRFLDHRLERYPPWSHGGNGTIRYADIEAVRVIGEFACGWRNAFDTLWARYGLPLAVTECHLGCDEENQKRWLVGCWNAALSAREQGIPVQAVTAWSLLGATDWDSLLTLDRGSYEPGVFAVSNNQPRQTGLTGAVRSLAKGVSGALDTRIEDAWWRSENRLIYPALSATPESRTRHNYPIL